MWRKLLSLKTFIMGEKKKESEEKLLEKVTSTEYKYGFTTDIESEKIQKGLSEDVIKTISKKKNEPLWMLEYRLKAYKIWLKMDEPEWANISYKKPKYQDIIYYS